MEQRDDTLRAYAFYLEIGKDTTVRFGLSTTPEVIEVRYSDGAIVAASRGAEGYSLSRAGVVTDWRPPGGTWVPIADPVEWSTQSPS